MRCRANNPPWQTVKTVNRFAPGLSSATAVGAASPQEKPRFATFACAHEQREDSERRRVRGRHLWPNHLRIYRQLEQSGAGVRLAAIVDTDPGTARKLREEENLTVFSSPEACLQACREGRLHLDAVSICVPTSAHYSVASQALAHGLDVLLEKPIAVTLAEADALVGQAAASRQILQVGLLERFNPAVTAAQSLVNGPMFFEAHRLSVFHRRALDVDVVLDLMIHDLDIVLSLVRSPVDSSTLSG